MEAMSTAIQEIFANDAHVVSRVEQVNYLWRRLKDGVPLVTPSGGHGVFINVKGFLPQVPPESFPAEALAAFIYYVSGILTCLCLWLRRAIAVRRQPVC